MKREPSGEKTTRSGTVKKGAKIGALAVAVSAFAILNSTAILSNLNVCFCFRVIKHHIFGFLGRKTDNFAYNEQRTSSILGYCI